MPLPFDPIELPLTWRIATRLPTFGHALDRAPLHWPEGPTPVLLGVRESFDVVGGWAGTPELVFLETDRPGELRALAAWVAAKGTAALAIVSGEASQPQLRRELVRRAPNLHCVERQAQPADTLQHCARETELLLRRAVCGGLLRRLRAEDAELAQTLAAVGLDAIFEPPRQARMAPLESQLSSYVRAVTGVWWATRPKAEAALEVAAGTARRLRSLPPPAFEALRSPEAPPLRLWVIDRELRVADVVARVIPDVLAGANVARPVALPTPAAALEKAAREGRPDVVLLGLD